MDAAWKKKKYETCKNWRYDINNAMVARALNKDICQGKEINFGNEKEVAVVEIWYHVAAASMISLWQRNPTRRSTIQLNE